MKLKSGKNFMNGNAYDYARAQLDRLEDEDKDFVFMFPLDIGTGEGEKITLVTTMKSEDMHEIVGRALIQSMSLNKAPDPS